MSTYVIIGGGTAGCVLAGRLSEVATNRVVLVEAGKDFPEGRVPEDITSSYAGRALYNRDYFWPGLRAARDDKTPATSYEQARVIGGGSSINGQVALRGSPADFDRWEALGARGWNWQSVLPYFLKLETDLDFASPYHGAEGPISIQRVPENRWDGFTASVVKHWQAEGYRRREDMNGSFEDGFAPVPISRDHVSRASTATGYLSASVRQRQNLTVMTETEVDRIVIESGRATGVEARQKGEPVTLDADYVIVCAGGLGSPWLLMKSGIGAADELSQHRVKPLLDRPGVGKNLQDHPTISIVAYMAPATRRRVLRHNFVNLIYSSGMDGMPAGDMVMSVICKTAWHALGDRFGALSTYVGKPYSRGRLSLAPNSDGVGPKVIFNWLSDERDVDRACQSFRMMAAMLRSPAVTPAVLEIFATGFSPRVKKIGALTTYNRLTTELAGFTMDRSPFLRHQIIRNFAADGPMVDDLLADDGALRSYLRATTTGIWHPCGTCRMGASDDPMAVVDPEGGVIGTDNITVADASIIPEIPTTNLNIPTIMIAEHIADILKRRL